MIENTLFDFYRGKKVFVTGHTGFKGSWLCKILSMTGAEVTGYALAPEGEENLFGLCGVENEIHSVIGDIRDFDSLKRAFDLAQPEIVFHLAAQPIVRESYRNPLYTYHTNVMGTANILECARLCDSLKSFLNVTTDKVYRNNESGKGFCEDDLLDGFDPYSNSKSCSELVTATYKRSFFSDNSTAISTARAGNVIGGGDFSKDRIIPDCVRSAMVGKPIIVRNPHSVRPYQQVLEPLRAYLEIAAKQYEDVSFADCYNVGPKENDAVTTGELADIFCRLWEGASWKNVCEDNAPHEAGYLMLDCTKLRDRLGISPKWDIYKAMEKTVEWYKVYAEGGDCSKVTEKQILEFFTEIKE